MASQKYDDLDQNNPNMGEFAKVSNAIITGTAESLSEMLGAGVSKAWMSTLFKTLGKEKAQEAIKRGIMGKMQELYKKFGMFFEPVNEGVEEVSSTLAENITDKINWCGSGKGFDRWCIAEFCLWYGRRRLFYWNRSVG